MTRSTPSSRTSGRSLRSVVEYRLVASVWLIGALSAAPAARAEPPGTSAGHAADVEAEFRGCDAAGWCRFRIEPTRASGEPLRRVRPDGVPGASGNDALATAIRDRLNALLASMIHQHKRIRLYRLRELDDGIFGATVTVNEADVASDPALLELRGLASGTSR
jgi:hypothetical protein